MENNQKITPEEMSTILQGRQLEANFLWSQVEAPISAWDIAALASNFLGNAVITLAKGDPRLLDSAKDFILDLFEITFAILKEGKATVMKF